MIVVGVAGVGDVWLSCQLQEMDERGDFGICIEFERGEREGVFWLKHRTGGCRAVLHDRWYVCVHLVISGSEFTECVRDTPGCTFVST